MIDGVLNIVSVGLAFSLLGLGVFLSRSVFNIIDLTCEPSFAIGGCAYGIMILSGINPLVALFFVMILGYFAGILTSAFINYIKLNSVIASMLTLGCFQSVMIKLISVDNLRRATLESLLGSLSAGNNLLISVLIAGGLAFLFYRFITSEYGLAMRVYGNGPIITESMGIDGIQALTLGLGISNLLCAVGGALVAQISGAFSPQMGNGCLIFGISSIILGERMLGLRGFKCAVISTFVGAISYQIVLKIFTSRTMMGFGEEYNSIILALTLIFLVALRQTGSSDVGKSNIWGVSQ